MWGWNERVGMKFQPTAWKLLWLSCWDWRDLPLNLFLPFPVSIHGKFNHRPQKQPAEWSTGPRKLTLFTSRRGFIPETEKKPHAEMWSETGSCLAFAHPRQEEWWPHPSPYCPILKWLAIKWLQSAHKIEACGEKNHFFPAFEKEDLAFSSYSSLGNFICSHVHHKDNKRIRKREEAPRPLKSEPHALASFQEPLISSLLPCAWWPHSKLP